MMKQKVKQHEQKSLEVKIKNLQNENIRAKDIQEKLLDVYENRIKYKCLSQDEVDAIFGHWDDLNETDVSLVGVKKTIIDIKEMMFDDDDECP